MKENRKLVIRSLGESFRECTEIVVTAVEEPGLGQVLVRNHYAGVNGVYDQMMCLDRIEHTAVVPPADTGVEAVGVVVRVGDGVVGIRPGDTVATVNVGGGYRYWQTCAAETAIPVPAATPEVLALVPSGVSALLALERVGHMRRGEIVCITAAAGGLGNIMTQLAVAADNEVVAICGSDAKAEALRGLGAARVIRYRRESLGDVVRRDYGDRLDLVMDSVGGEVFDLLVDNLAPHGRLVICGYTSDRLPTATVREQRIYTKLYWKAASVRGFMNYRFSRHAPEARQRLLGMLAEGRLRPLIDATHFAGLETIPDAVEHLLAGANVGKVVVDLRDPE